MLMLISLLLKGLQFFLCGSLALAQILHGPEHDEHLEILRTLHFLQQSKRRRGLHENLQRTFKKTPIMMHKSVHPLHKKHCDVSTWSVSCMRLLRSCRNASNETITYTRVK